MDYCLCKLIEQVRREVGLTSTRPDEAPSSLPSGGPQPRPLTLWLKPVRREDLPVTREVLLHAALPSLTGWVAHTATAMETWLDTRHERRWRLQGGTVRELDADGSATFRPGRDD